MKSRAGFVISVIVNAILLVLFSLAYRQIRQEYYRAVWNTCLFGVVGQARSVEHAMRVCAVAYWRAQEMNWFDQAWPPVPENR